MVTRLTRAQLHLYTQVGESVTSTRLTFDERESEYLTVETLVWLFGFTPEGIIEFCDDNGVKVYQKNGQRWLNCSDLVPLLFWTT